jgi:peptidoglycan/LPS O-acetylase OafA/YrhL
MNSSHIATGARAGGGDGARRARIDAIDYLRGILALSIVLFHYQSWSHIRVGAGAEQFLSKCSIYAVCAFYVISGLSFGYVYRDRRVRLRWIAAFFVKRFMRLAPVYWIAIAGTAMLGIVARHTGGAYVTPSLGQIVTNVTLTFGVIEPAGYLPTGGWSIGNEMVFYLLLPTVLLFRARFRIIFYLGIATCLAIGCEFAFRQLAPSVSLAGQWDTYIVPFNHLYFFVVGVWLGGGVGRARVQSSYAGILAVVAGVAFVALPAGADPIAITTGWYRVLYSIVCIGVCAGCAYANVRLPELVHKGLEELGRMSYSVYLLHPIVYGGMSYVLWGFRSSAVVAVASLPATLLGARFVYRWLEAPMIERGVRVARSISGAGRGLPVDPQPSAVGAGVVSQ